jgi:prepilin-type N-terminal cleavage/methylation domain-containing protein
MNIIEHRKAMAGQGGFTLVELLVVVAILGILAGVAVFAVGNLTGNANRNACQIEVRSVRTAVAAFRADSVNNPLARFPTAPASLASYLDTASDAVSVGAGTLTLPGSAAANLSTVSTAAPIYNTCAG